MRHKLLVLLMAAVTAVIAPGCASLHHTTPASFSQFIGVDHFTNFSTTCDETGNIVLLSPYIHSRAPWDQLIVSWNADAPGGTFLKVEAAAEIGTQHTRFYVLGNWSPDGTNFPRTSLRGQHDAEATVKTDTLELAKAGDAVQLRLTLGGANGATPVLKFIGLSLANSKVEPAGHPSNGEAWGKSVDTPQRSQFGFAGAQGWCSPASVSMVLAYWGKILRRPELDVPVPQVAAAVYDSDYAGTGNWPFNTAFAGGFPGMRAYLTRFDDLDEVEQWVAAGIPVILSVRWDLLEPGRPVDTDGHLVVCTGFTERGDVIVNDPAARLDRGESVRRIYRRKNVLAAWAHSMNTVYLVYPEEAHIPVAASGHW
jgi:hypothetical protein